MKAIARRFKVSDVENLITVIEKNTRKQTRKRSETIEIELWDGRIVVGTPLKSHTGKVDFDTIYPTVLSQQLSVYVRALVNQGVPFITRTGKHETSCTIRWTIEDSKEN